MNLCRKKKVSRDSRRSETALRRLFPVVLGIVLAWHSETAMAESADVAAAGDESAYVSDGLCRECHRAEHDAWLASHHNHAMAPATEASVLGNFDGHIFSHGGKTTVFLQDGDRFYLLTEGPDGNTAEFDVLFTFGYYPLQQYLVALPGGRLQAFDVAWDVDQGRWFKLSPGAEPLPGDTVHWTGAANLWNTACGDCHTTNLQKNYDPGTGRFNSTWSAVNVGCQACHGPGAEHVAWAAGLSESVTRGDAIKGLPFRSGSDEAQDEMVVCAQCHSRRQRIAPATSDARDLLDEVVPALLAEGLYHADGQVLDEVYVYGSFLQSREYEAGVSCSDCHEPHSGGLRAEGNGLCIQCHQESPPDRFPSLQAKLYDSPEHHKHETGSDGALCVNCHMPETTFREIDARRDHSFRVPRPDLSSRLGVPNACTGCHEDESDRWASQVLDEWYGRQWRRPHFGEALHAGRRALPGASEELAELIADSAQPGLVRATALSLLPRNLGPMSPAAYQAALGDADPLMRLAALEALDPFSPEQRWQVAAALLTDPVRAVRIAAGRALAAMPSDGLSKRARKDLKAAIAEYRQAQSLAEETLEANLNLAGLDMDLGDLEAAEMAYRRALAADPNSLKAILAYGALHRDLGRFAEAASLYREAIERQPMAPELRHALALLQARLGDHLAATEQLRKAVELAPRNPHYKYLLANALARYGEPDEALELLRDAHFFAPRNREILLALAIISRDQGETVDAITFVEKLLDLDPNDEQALNLLELIENDS